MLDARSILARPAAYRLFVRMVTGDFQARYVRDYVQPEPGQRVFDIGCGPGDVLAHLPGVEYTGIDISPEYIQAAQARFGKRGVFRCEDAAQAAFPAPASFDIVMANGVLHHLPDAEARGLLALARDALKPGGRLVTHDPCYVPKQSVVARTLLGMDRGHHVRERDEYTALAAEVFAEVRSYIRHDLLNVPYTHHIMVCTDVRAAEQRRRAA